LPFKILFTIPNFDTAGSQIPLLTIAKLLDPKKFLPEIACLHGKGDYFQEVLQSNIKVHFIPFISPCRPIHKIVMECNKVGKIFKSIAPDIIHSYNYGSDYTEAIAAKMAGIKWIFTKKNMSWKGPSYRGWKLRSWLADGIITQNQQMMESFYPKNSKTEMIPIGVDSKEFKRAKPNPVIMEKWGISTSDRLLMVTANLVPVKGVEILISAFKNIAADFPHWKLLIVGDDKNEYGKMLNDMVKSSDTLIKRVIFTGKSDNVKQFLDLAELFVQPTLNQGRMEGAPISILEAMANGKVVLGSAVPGITDQLEEFQEYLFTPGNVGKLQSKLIKFMQNSSADNKRIGAEFFHYVNRKYTVEIELTKLQEFYLKILHV
jgi:glycosyltransferase involved in cell wall biosynthesis